METTNFLEEKVGITLIRTSNLAKVHGLQRFSTNNFSITPEQFGILNLLVQKGILYQRQIGEIMFKDRPNITRLIKILEKDGLIKRISDEQNKKIVKIDITEKGKKVHAKILPTIKQLRSEVINNINNKDLETCLQVLEKIQNNLKEIVTLQL